MRIVRLFSGTESIRLSMSLLPVSITQGFDSTSPRTLIDSDSSAQATIVANSLVGSNGLPQTGLVTGRLTVIDPSGNPGLLPGDFTERLNNLVRMLESYGAIQVDFSDNQGNVLDLFNGATSTIRIPIARSASNPPATVFLCFFDEASGRWVATNQIATLDPPRTFYEGLVPHLDSTWCACKPFPVVVLNAV